MPNILTLGRVAAVPGVVALLYVPGEASRLGALALFLLASLTDFFDGWLARRYELQSRFGTMLDPIADKLLVGAVLVMLVTRGTVTGLGSLAVLLILMREIFVSGLREFLALEQVVLPVSRLAKWKTTLQMAALAGLLAFGETQSAGKELALGLLWLAALVSLWTGAQYMMVAFGARNAGRA